MLKNFDINEFHLGNNLYVDASAGTGKTYTIQQLVAKLVRGEGNHAGIPLSKILIVTYTDKATGELRDRIRQKMEECLAEENLECSLLIFWLGKIPNSRSFRLTCSPTLLLHTCSKKQTERLITNFWVKASRHISKTMAPLTKTDCLILHTHLFLNLKSKKTHHHHNTFDNACRNNLQEELQIRFQFLPSRTGISLQSIL